jgi:hydroxymethylpyrimidine pyrophosphatase-like HAD family hydrolase
VGKGFIMGNAHDKLKAALPNNPIIETNDEDAVANTLEKLFLE